MTEEDELLGLHKYWIWCDEMRRNFNERIKQHPLPRNADAGRAVLEDVILMCYLSLWYSLLYVLCEAWQKKRNLRDVNIEQLLSNEEMLGKLKKFRNGTFHYQPRYFDPQKFIPFLVLGRESAGWARQVHGAFKEFFERRFAEQGWWPEN